MGQRQALQQALALGLANVNADRTSTWTCQGCLRRGCLPRCCTLLQLDNPEDVFVFAAEASKLTPPSPEPEAESLIDKIASCCRVFTFADADADEHAGERLEPVLVQD